MELPFIDAFSMAACMPLSPWSGESWIILCPRLGKEKVQANNKISKCFIVLY